MNELNFEQELKAIVSKVPSDVLQRELGRLKQLLQLKVDSEEALREVALSENHSIDIRTFACWILGRMAYSEVEDEMSKTIATLIHLQASENIALRIVATQSLGSFQSNNVVKALIETLHDDNIEVRKTSAQALGWINSEKAIVSLVEKLKDTDENPSVRGVVAEALGNSGNQKVIHDLIDMLDSEHAEVRFWSIYALGELCAEEAISKLEQMVSDNTSISTYGTIGQEAKDALERISECDSSL